MVQRTKLSGAALAAELSGLAFPQSGLNPPPPPASEPSSAAPALPAATITGQSDADGTRDPHRDASPSKVVTGPSLRGGRPAKAGVDGIPVNVRLSQSDHLALAKLAGKLMVPGRPLPTVQDVVRTLIRGALNEPEVALRLSQGRE